MQEQENTDGDGQTHASLFRAAQYVRMSTEHQPYSTENQTDKIKEYAARRGIEIIKTYADEGKSGLRINGRQTLQRLIHDVESGQADFQVILVYDVSRWGRFQDAERVLTTSTSAAAPASRSPIVSMAVKTRGYLAQQKKGTKIAVSPLDTRGFSPRLTLVRCVQVNHDPWHVDLADVRTISVPLAWYAQRLSCPATTRNTTSGSVRSKPINRTERGENRVL